MDDFKRVYIVERYFDEPIILADIEEQERQSKSCFDMRNVSFLHTYVSPDRKRTICVYEAPDAESVREAQREAGLPFERVWAADHH